MQLANLAREAPGGRLAGTLDTEIHGISHDSREVKPGDLFVCLVGEKYDGHRFAAEAISRGAAALVVDEAHEADAPIAGGTLVVADTRRALPEFSAAVYGDPSRHLLTVGVTGTN